MRRVMGMGALFAAVFVCLLPVVASARRSASAPARALIPDQLYLGAHVLTGPIAGRVHFRPMSRLVSVTT